MATCGHCKQPGQTIQHVRTCGQVGSAERTLPELVPGNVVTVASAIGPVYWEVISVVPGTHPYEVQLVRAGGHKGAISYIRAEDVELVFPNLSAAADYEVLSRSEETKRRNRETLHGDPDYCRGCAKGWAGAKWHRDGCPAVQSAQETSRDVSESHQWVEENKPWAPVNELRNRVKAHLHYETKQGTHKRMGHFAIEADGTLKFLVVKELLAGRHAGRVFVDSMGSDTAYPVKAPATLTAYLTAVLADPKAAAKRYADELDVCSDCGRTLTNDESRARGIGPECWAKRVG